MAITDNYAPDKSSGNAVTVAFSGNWNTISADYFRLYWEDKTTGVQTLKTLNTHYTLAFTASGYTATHDAAFVPPATVWVIRSRDIAKTQAVPYKTASGFQGAVHENSYDKVTAISQELQEQIDRTPHFPLGSAITDAELPIPVDGYGLVWDGVLGVLRNTDFSMTLLELQAAELYAIAADIVTVAGISANVTTVAGIHANVTTVAGIATETAAVGAIAASVVTVAGISANVTTVAGISGNVTTVAGISANVTTVAGISANVTTVAGVSANVTTVATNIANVNTVAGISANVTTVAGISANVTTVAGDHTAITAVAADLVKIDAVYADLTKIDGVYADLTKIDAVYADLTKIDAVYADLANIDAVYAGLTNINTVATAIAAVNTVSTNIAAVNTCSTNIAAILDAPAQAAAAAASAASAAASASGISMRGSCRVCTTGALTVTYANGVLGVGATLTNAGVQAAFASDGVTVAVGERVLVQSQAAPAQNGMYTLTVAGTGATNWVMTRATDYDEASEVVEGTATIIEEGTVNASHIYVMTHHGAIVMGTTAIDFTALTANATSANTLTTPRTIGGVSFDGSANIVPQTIQSINEATDTTCFPLFITASGSQSLQPMNNTSLTFNSNTGAFGATSLGGTLTTASQPNVTGVGTIGTGVWQGTKVAEGYGGTNQATYTQGDILYASAANTLSKLAKGNTNDILTQTATIPSWAAPASQTGGATASSGSSSLTLTSSSNRMQSRSMTAAGLSVILPDATTLVAGGVLFCVVNTGSYSFTIRANGGAVKVILAAGESCMLWCSDISTAAGVWASGNVNSLAAEMFSVNPTVLVLTGSGASGTTGECICPISSTTGLVLLYDTTATAAMKAAVITVTGEALSVGTLATVEALATGVTWSAVALDSTHVLVTYSGTTDTRAMVLSISGTTVTANTALSIEAAISHNHYVFKIDASTAYLGYSKNTGTKSAGVILSISGTTITMPGAITYGAATIVAAEGNMAVAALDTTHYYYAYAGTSGFLAGQVFSVSGSTVTANTAVTNMSNSILQGNICVTAASSSCVVIASTPATTASINMYVCTVAANVITQRASQVAAFATTTTGPKIKGINMINGTFGVCTVVDTLWVSAGSVLLGFIQCGFKVEPINGDIMIEPVKKTYQANAATNSNVGYPRVGPITTSNGQWASTMSDNATGKSCLFYMNASI